MSAATPRAPTSLARRRIVLMRHGAVRYFDDDGRPLGSDDVPLTAQGITQAGAAGAALKAAGLLPDRVITSGLPRTRATAQHVLAAAGLDLTPAHWPEWAEIRGGRLAAIPADRLRAAFTATMGGLIGGDVRHLRFLDGESIGELQARVLPAWDRLLGDPAWDTALLVLHGGVNRALLSHVLAGPGSFLGGLEQDPGALNVIDVGASAAEHVVRVVNHCPLDALQAASRATTMEHLLDQYLRSRTTPDLT